MAFLRRSQGVPGHIRGSVLGALAKSSWRAFCTLFKLNIHGFDIHIYFLEAFVEAFLGADLERIKPLAAEWSQLLKMEGHSVMCFFDTIFGNVRWRSRGGLEENSRRSQSWDFGTIVGGPGGIFDWILECRT